jgi:hypothetical protein
MPITHLGPEVPLGRVKQPDTGHGASTYAELPLNALLCRLQLGWDGEAGTRWLNVAYRSLVGGGTFELGGDVGQFEIYPPPVGGGSAPAHVPEGSILYAIGLSGGWHPTLLVAYRGITSSTNFKLGPEELGPGSKEPADNGGGPVAKMDGYTITGFQWQEDPGDGQLGLTLWYRKVL